MIVTLIFLVVLGVNYQLWHGGRVVRGTGSCGLACVLVMVMVMMMVMLVGDRIIRMVTGLVSIGVVVW